MTSIPQKLADLMSHYKKMVQNQVFKTIQPRKLTSISTIENSVIEEAFWDQIQDYPARGGKYVRSILICLTCEALGGNIEDALPTAASMELSQNWILIHDDIQDNSNMRRGDKALHLKIGIDHAINAGVRTTPRNQTIKIIDPYISIELLEILENSADSGTEIQILTTTIAGNRSVNEPIILRKLNNFSSDKKITVKQVIKDGDSVNMRNRIINPFMIVLLWMMSIS